MKVREEGMEVEEEAVMNYIYGAKECPIVLNYLPALSFCAVKFSSAPP